VDSANQGDVAISCPSSFLLLRPAGVSSSRGKRKGFWLNAWRTRWVRWMKKACCNGRRPSWTAISLRQKRGAAVGKTKRGKGTKWMVLVDGQGLPLGVRLESVSPSEVALAEATLAEVRVVPRGKGARGKSPSE
jgi:hypothetical protein